MTSRERVIAALEHREPDVVPFDLGSMHSTIETYAYSPLKKFLNIAVSKPIKTFVRDHVEIDEEILVALGVDTRYLRIQPPENWKLEIEEDNSFVDEWGTRYKKPPNSLYFDPVEFPLANASIDDLKRYKCPDPDDPGRIKGLKERTKYLYEHTDYALCLDTVGLGMFETTWMVRGLENFLCDIMIDPKFAHTLLEKISEHKIALYKNILGEIGEYIQAVFVSDDLGTQKAPMMSMDVYRKVLKPHHKQIWKAVKGFTDAKLFFHSCGSVYQYIPDLIEMGIDILNPVQASAAGMETHKLKNEFGKYISFWGAVDQQTVISVGSPLDVQNEVRKRINDLAIGGGYVVAPSHNLQADVIPQNIISMAKAAKYYGVYPLRGKK
jgi:uroporphyrinogen decarboxylase